MRCSEGISKGINITLFCMVITKLNWNIRALLFLPNISQVKTHISISISHTLNNCLWSDTFHFTEVNLCIQSTVIIKGNKIPHPTKLIYFHLAHDCIIFTYQTPFTNSIIRPNGCWIIHVLSKASYTCVVVSQITRNKMFVQHFVPA